MNGHVLVVVVRASEGSSFAQVRTYFVEPVAQANWVTSVAHEVRILWARSHFGGDLAHPFASGIFVAGDPDTPR